uniref:Uncharacterized protein n=1 Tax=Cannabis sativa TaxID=3483 RepID=A0A803PYA7_CANSA
MFIQSHDEVGKIFVIADERADLSKPETIPATLVGIHTVIDCATGCPEEPIKTRAKGDVNMVKLGLVHFLANFAFGTIPETKVSNFFWNIVDSADANIKQFPYGKHLWEKSRHSMRLSLMKKEETFEKMFDEKTGKLQPYSYKLFGFPYAFFIWIFETIPALSLTFCEKELEGKKLKGALIRDDHDCTDEVVDAAYSGFIAAMKFIQKSKREGTQITKNEEPHTPFVVVSPDLKSTTEKAKLSTENMVDLEKREPKPSAIFQSPFVTDFGSSEPVPVGKRKNLEIVKGIIPFRKEIGKNATTEETQAYNDWKKIMHSGTINLLVTTTDSIFYKVVRTTYESYLANGSNVINQESIIAKYMSGQSLSCSVPWYYLDHVAIPAHVTDEVHYILAHFNIRERCLVVYNSLTPRVNIRKVNESFSWLVWLLHKWVSVRFSIMT